jgi:heterodisulfide reductase subunit C
MSKKANMRFKAKKRGIIKEYLGDKCLFCKYMSRLTIHNKKGQPHQRVFEMRLEDMINALKSNEYVFVCFKCHKSVHWCMKHLHLTWTDIIKLLDTPL